MKNIKFNVILEKLSQRGCFIDFHHFDIYTLVLIKIESFLKEPFLLKVTKHFLVVSSSHILCNYLINKAFYVFDNHYQKIDFSIFSCNCLLCRKNILIIFFLILNLSIFLLMLFCKE